MLVYLCLLIVSVAFCKSVCRIHFCPVLPIMQAVKHETLTQCFDGEPTLAHYSGYRVMFGATLNVGQRHRRQASNNPALVQSIEPVSSACRYRQHEVGLLTRVEWILASTGDAGPTFNRHWAGVGLYSPPALSTTKEVI